MKTNNNLIDLDKYDNINTDKQSSHAYLDIYDLLGREVRSLIDETMQAGDHEDFWDGKNNFNEPVETGIYFFQLRVGKMRQIRKMVLLK